MPRSASTSRKARKCNGSLLAITPSKSNTIARITASGPRLVFQLFSSVDRHFEPVFGWRIRTLEGGVVDAVRMVGLVEIELVNAAGGAIEVDVAPGCIRLGAARHVAEHSRQPVDVGCAALDEGRERHRLPLERDLECAAPPHLAGLTAGGGHHQRLLFGRG